MKKKANNTIGEQNKIKEMLMGSVGYPVMPSPMKKHWLCYIRHDLKMVKKGIAAYKHANTRDSASTNTIEPAFIFLGNVKTAGHMKVPCYHRR